VGSLRAGERRPQSSVNDEEALSSDRSSALEENVQAIKRWEIGASITVNAGALRGVRPFDPFPFPS
jgi:hypothetical protein